MQSNELSDLTRGRAVSGVLQEYMDPLQIALLKICQTADQSIPDNRMTLECPHPGCRQQKQSKS